MVPKVLGVEIYGSKPKLLAGRFFKIARVNRVRVGFTGVEPQLNSGV